MRAEKDHATRLFCSTSTIASPPSSRRRSSTAVSASTSTGASPSVCQARLQENVGRREGNVRDDAGAERSFALDTHLRERRHLVQRGDLLQDDGDLGLGSGQPAAFSGCGGRSGQPAAPGTSSPAR